MDVKSADKGIQNVPPPHYVAVRFLQSLFVLHSKIHLLSMPKRTRSSKGQSTKGGSGTATTGAADTHAASAHAASMLMADLQAREAAQTQPSEESADEEMEEQYAAANQLPEFVAKVFQFATSQTLYDASPNSKANDFGFVDDLSAIGVGSRGFSSTHSLCAAMCKKTSYVNGAERELLSFSQEDEGKVRILLVLPEKQYYTSVSYFTCSSANLRFFSAGSVLMGERG